MSVGLHREARVPQGGVYALQLSQLLPVNEWSETNAISSKIIAVEA